MTNTTKKITVNVRPVMLYHYQTGKPMPECVNQWRIFINGIERGKVRHSVASFAEDYYIVIPELGISSNNYSYCTKQGAVDAIVRLYSIPGYYATWYKQQYLKVNADAAAARLERIIAA